MAENLKAQLSKLIELQKLDSQVYALGLKKQSMPEEIKAIEAVFESKKQNLKNLENSFLELQKQKKEEELNFASKEEGAKKLQGQLFQLKTNKDYQAMLHQIADAKADGSVIEDKILQIMENMDKVKADIEKEKQALVKEEKVFNEDKIKIQDNIKEIDDSLRQLEAQKKQIMPNIEQNIYAQYERILHSRDGLAIVTVKNNSCQGCNMSVPHQVINLVKMYEHIVTCEMCNRMLYINEDVE